MENYVAEEEEDPATPGRPVKSRESLSALVEVILAIAPDILGVAEIGGSQMLEDLRKRLRMAGLDFSHVEWVDSEDSERKLGLLSRFPIVQKASRTDVPFELMGRRFRVLRGILDVTVRPTPDFDLRLVGAHLKSRRPGPTVDQAQFRAKEAWHLRDHINSIFKSQPDAKILVFGDFNETKNEYPVRELIGTRGTPNYLFDLRPTDSRGDRWTHYWSESDTYSRIDYLLASPSLVPHLDQKESGVSDFPKWNLASDHRLIYAVINLQPE